MNRVAPLALALAVAIVASAHVGSPNVIFDGNAGPYPVRVIIRPPEVVPGIAEVIVRVDAPDAQRVVIRPVYWHTGVGGAPAGDEMKRVAGQDRVYTGQLWLMNRGKRRPIEGAPSLALDNTSLALDYERVSATRQFESGKRLVSDLEWEWAARGGYRAGGSISR